MLVTGTLSSPPMDHWMALVAIQGIYLLRNKICIVLHAIEVKRQQITFIDGNR